jgi:hypothetical protein
MPFPDTGVVVEKTGVAEQKSSPGGESKKVMDPVGWRPPREAVALMTPPDSGCAVTPSGALDGATSTAADESEHGVGP